MHTNQTQHYGFPLYVGTDIINPLTDFNETNEAIDEALYNANTASAQAVSKATEAEENVALYDTRIADAEAHASESLLATQATRDMIAYPFDPLKQGGYAIGDAVIHEGKLYEFIVSHTGAWDASDVKVVVITDSVKDTVEQGKEEIEQEVDAAIAVISQQTAKVTATQAIIAEPFNPAKVGGYKAGDFVTYADKLYRFDEAHTGAWSESGITNIVLTQGMRIYGLTAVLAEEDNERYYSLLNRLFTQIDMSRVTVDTVIEIRDFTTDDADYFKLAHKQDDELVFQGFRHYATNGTYEILNLDVKASSSLYDGTKITTSDVTKVNYSTDDASSVQITLIY